MTCLTFSQALSRVQLFTKAQTLAHMFILALGKVNSCTTFRHSRACSSNGRKFDWFILCQFIYLNSLLSIVNNFIASPRLNVDGGYMIARLRSVLSSLAIQKWCLTGVRWHINNFYLVYIQAQTKTKRWLPIKRAPRKGVL